MLASVQSPGVGVRGPGSPSDVGAGQPAASRARRADTAPAMVRILALPGDAGRSVPAGQPAAQRGLGFLVDARGYVLTHSDVIRDGKGLEAALPDGRTFAVKQVWRDPLAGIAILRIDGRDLPALPLGDSNGLRVGDAAAIVGWPAASAPPPVSATIRATGAATGGNLAIDAPIQAENVGGPLLNARGQVVGIASADAHFMDGSSRGFAVPIDRAKSMLREAQASAAPARPTFTSGR
jgi:serine protease Do